MTALDIADHFHQLKPLQLRLQYLALELPGDRAHAHEFKDNSPVDAVVKATFLFFFAPPRDQS